MQFDDVPPDRIQWRWLLIYLGAALAVILLSVLLAKWLREPYFDIKNHIQESLTPSAPRQPKPTLYPARSKIYYSVGRYPFCLTEERLITAMEKMARGNERWVEQAPDCIITGLGLKMRPFTPGLKYSKVILITPSGQSYTGYTPTINLGE